MKKIIVLFLLVFLLITNQLNAQYVNVKINSTPVCGEEWITINPKNTNQIVAGTNKLFNNPQSCMGYYYTSNGGYNWNEGMLMSTLAQTGSDPVVLVDTIGNFYYICVTNWMITPPYGDKLICSKSTNGGMNWDNGTLFALLNKFDDMPMGCIDHSHSQYGNNIYVTWTLFDSLQSNDPYDSSYVYFTRSTDMGSTFSIPTRVSKIAGHGFWDIYTPEGPVPCTGPNGEIYVCYPYNQKVLFNRSTDGGFTWLDSEIVASNQVGGWVGMHSPVVTCDISGSQFSGYVYICFSDLRSGTYDRDIWFIRSTNSGNNWSTPIRVNNDTPGRAQLLPWICVDRVTGYIWIVFYDGRNYPNGSRYEVYVARSTDGGITFQNTRVSNVNTSTLSGLFLGEYIGISAYNNKVRPIWSTTVAFGNSNLWTAIIDTFTIGIRPISSEVPNRFMLYQNYPNPFNPSTNIKYQITKNVKSETSNVKLIIFDILGKEVATLVNEKQSPGTYEVSWDGTNYPSGVYYYTLQTDTYKETKKMILVK
jgi:hypothetical protein